MEKSSVVVGGFDRGRKTGLERGERDKKHNRVLADPSPFIVEEPNRETFWVVESQRWAYQAKNNLRLPLKDVFGHKFVFGWRSHLEKEWCRLIGPQHRQALPLDKTPALWTCGLGKECSLLTANRVDISKRKSSL